MRRCWYNQQRKCEPLSRFRFCSDLRSRSPWTARALTTGRYTLHTQALDVRRHVRACRAFRVRACPASATRVDRRLRHKNTLAVTTGPGLRLPVARERQVSQP
jgi:hypothetical protein